MARSHVAPPSSGFFLPQCNVLQSSSQIAAITDSLTIGCKPCERFTILQQNKRNVLIMGAVYEIREVAGGFRDADAEFFLNIQIIDYQTLNIDNKIHHHAR